MEELDRIRNKLDLMRRRLNILAILYPNTIISKTELAEKSGIRDEGNLSKYLDELEESGFVSTFRIKAKGNDRRMVNLSDLSSELLTSFMKREKPLLPRKVLTDESYLVSTLGLLKETDQDIRRIAARELVDIMRAYIILPNNPYLLHMEIGVTGEADPDVLTHLLEALSIAVNNSPIIREKAKDRLVNPLSTIAMEKGEIIDNRTTNLAIKILAAVSEGEYRYNILLPIYKALIKNKSQSSRTAIDSLISHHSERRTEIRQELLKIFKDASEEERDLIKGHLAVI